MFPTPNNLSLSLELHPYALQPNPYLLSYSNDHSLSSPFLLSMLFLTSPTLGDFLSSPRLSRHHCSLLSSPLPHWQPLFPLLVFLFWRREERRREERRASVDDGRGEDRKRAATTEEERRESREERSEEKRGEREINWGVDTRVLCAKLLDARLFFAKLLKISSQHKSGAEMLALNAS